MRNRVGMRQVGFDAKAGAWFSLMFALAFALAVAAVGAAAFGSADSAYADVRAGSSALAPESEDDDWCDIATPLQGSVTWDPATCTITMVNAMIDMNEQSEYQHAIYVDAFGFASTPTVTLKLVGENTIHIDTDHNDLIFIRYANLRVVGPGKLSILANTSGNAINVFQGNLALESGTLHADGKGTAIHASGTVAVTGADVQVRGTGEDAIAADKGFTATKGSVRISGCSNGIFTGSGDLVVDGASVTIADATSHGLFANGADIHFRSGNVSLNDTGQSIEANDGHAIFLGGATVHVVGGTYGMIVQENGSIVASAGSFSANRSEQGIYLFEGAFTVSGGSISLDNIENGAIDVQNFTMSKGSVSVDDCLDALNATFGSFTMSGGTMKVVNARQSGIRANNKLTISGGSVTVKCKSAACHAFLCPNGMTNKAGTLVAVVGSLERGATFVAGGNTYALGADSEATLKSYGSTSKKPSVNTAKFGGCTYPVAAIGAKAFATKRGKAITQLTLGANVKAIGAKAFYGTSKLKVLNLKKFNPPAKGISKTAFQKCGKAAGKGLTVKCGAKAKRAKLKSLVTKKGLAKKAKFA